MNPDTLDAELISHLHFWLGQLSPAERRSARWVMSPEWFNDCRRAGRPDWPGWLVPVALTDPELLLGLPVEIRDDGGVPHLEQVAP